MDTYKVDYHWAWGTKNFGDPITLRAHLTFRDFATAQQAVTGFFNNLMEQNGHYGSGGWVASRVDSSANSRRHIIDFTAAGQDVADAIGYAADDAVEFFSSYPGTTVQWEQRPH